MWPAGRSSTVYASVDNGEEAVVIILTVDPDAIAPVGVTAFEEAGPPVVRAPGLLSREELDLLLRAAGAGTAPGHHAELRVEWLAVQPQVRSVPLGRWIDGPDGRGLVDESREWIMALIEWDDPAVPLAS